MASGLPKRLPRRPQKGLKTPKRPPRRSRWPLRRPWSTPRGPRVGPERPPKRLPTASDGPGAHQDGR
eukprot:8619837-Pyramimonas_sp.AAC.1